jgi:hypothetical protein
MRRATAVEGMPSSSIRVSATAVGAAGAGTADARRKTDIIPNATNRLISIESPSFAFGGAIFL